jgi:xylulokinase
MGIDTNRSSLIYSLIEGISFGLNDNYLALSKTGIELNNIYVIGGGSKNQYWIKLLASIMNKNLLITEASDAMAAYGAARIAYLGFNNINHDNVLSPPKVKTVIEKDHKLSQMLIDRFSKWKNFYVS